MSRKASRKAQSRLITQEEHWRYVEHIVAALEQSIVPTALIEHDVNLWDNQAQDWRQCDIVIRQGSPPRETLTIVEVQDRKQKVGTTMFDAWCRKREKIQAQHLICVSRMGFTKGVLNSARVLGNTVRLVEMKEIDQGTWPVRFAGGKLVIHWGGVPEIEHYFVATEGNRWPGPTFLRSEVMFLHHGQSVEVEPIMNLRFPVFACPTQVGEQRVTQRLEFPSEDDLLLTWEGNVAKVLAITRVYKLDVQLVELDMSLSEYRQIDHASALAWMATGRAQINGQEAELRVVLVPENSGLLKVMSVAMDGVFAGAPIAGIEFHYQI